MSALPHSTGDPLLTFKPLHTLAGTVTQLNAEGLRRRPGPPGPPPLAKDARCLNSNRTQDPVAFAV